MESFNLFQIVGAFLLLTAGAVFMIAGRERGLFLAIISLGSGCNRLVLEHGLKRKIIRLSAISVKMKHVQLKCLSKTVNK
mgnify:CR=1 FL=1